MRAYIAPNAERVQPQRIRRERIQQRWRSTCAYCGRFDYLTVDHLIPSASLSVVGKAVREDARYKVDACSSCNVAKGPRCFVPPALVELIPELERLTGRTYGVFDGTAESLRVVLR